MSISTIDSFRLPGAKVSVRPKSILLDQDREAVIAKRIQLLKKIHLAFSLYQAQIHCLFILDVLLNRVNQSNQTSFPN